VKAREYNRYNINRYYFQAAKLEAIHPLAVTANSGVVTNVADASGHITDYYGILQKNIEYTFGAPKSLRLCFLL
jgi:hypothetical protein